MTRWKNYYTIFIILFTISIVQQGQADELMWGVNTGLYNAKIVVADDTKGLTVRSEPTNKSRSIYFIPKGQILRGSGKFSDGWMMLGLTGGWVTLNNLKAAPFTGSVSRTDTSGNCLTLRKGPGEEFAKVRCASLGEKLKFTGIIARTNWLQLQDQKGWVPVDFIQVSSGVKRKKTLKIKGLLIYKTDMRSFKSEVTKTESPSSSEEKISDGVQLPPERVVGRISLPGNQDPPQEGGGNTPPPNQGGDLQPPGLEPVGDQPALPPDVGQQIEQHIEETGSPPWLPGGSSTICRDNYCVNVNLTNDTVTYTDPEGQEINLEACMPDCQAVVIAGEAYIAVNLANFHFTVPIIISSDLVFVLNPDGTIVNWQTGETVKNCGDPVNQDCVEEFITETVESQGQVQAQTAGPGPNQVGTLESQVGGGGESDTLAGPPSIAGNDEPTESSAGSDTSDESGWMTIQPVGPSGPTMTSDSENNGSSDGTGKKTPPDIGSAPKEPGNQGVPSSPAGFIVGGPAGGSGQSSSESSQDIGFTNPDFANRDGSTGDSTPVGRDDFDGSDSFFDSGNRVSGNESSSDSGGGFSGDKFSRGTSDVSINDSAGGFTQRDSSSSDSGQSGGFSPSVRSDVGGTSLNTGGSNGSSNVQLPKNFRGRR